jgi:hypothetical protein
MLLQLIINYFYFEKNIFFIILIISINVAFCTIKGLLFNASICFIICDVVVNVAAGAAVPAAFDVGGAAAVPAAVAAAAGAAVPAAFDVGGAAGAAATAAVVVVLVLYAVMTVVVRFLVVQLSFLLALLLLC